MYPAMTRTDEEVGHAWQMWHMILAGVVIAAFTLMWVSGKVLPSEPWMDTARLPLMEKRIAIYEDPRGYQRWYLVPNGCVGTDLHITKACLGQGIELPLQP